jgi:PTH1 family peptidyl-tRNA hydrolase
MFLVVGLGNPGREYEATRHNVGFAVVDLLQESGFTPWKSAENALVAKGKLAGADVLLVKPQTFMNLSGDAVGSLLRYYKVPVEQLVVVYDELDFEPGRVQAKLGGGHGGHNGIRSILGHVGREFVRVRVGIGKPPSKESGADYVLSRFDKREQILIEAALRDAALAVAKVIEKGAVAAMNEINRREA